jgi:hypothetical protein
MKNFKNIIFTAVAVVSVGIFAVSTMQAVAKAEDAKAEDLAKFIKTSGFADGDLASFARFGSPELKKKFEQAPDEFDKADVEKLIEKKLQEIKTKHFVLEVPFFTDNLKVDGDNGGVRLVVPIKFVQLQSFRDLKALKVKGGMVKGIECTGFTLCHPLVSPQYAGVIDSSISDIDDPILGKRFADEGKISLYLKGDRTGRILLFKITSGLDVIKKIVRSKDKFRIRIEISDIGFEPEMKGELYYFYKTLKSEDFISANVDTPKEGDEDPSIWVTRGKEDSSHVTAKIVSVELVETK